MRIVHISDTQLGFTDSRNRFRLSEELDIPEERLELEYTGIDKRYYERAVDKINMLNPRADVVVNTGDLVDSSDCARQWEDYREVTGKIESPVYEVIGNHDGFGGKGKEYYSFKVKGFFFLALNSQFLKKYECYRNEVLDQKEFMEKELSRNRDCEFKILLMHHPLYIQNDTEPEDYFSLPPVQRKWILDMLEEFNVSAVLSGHYHRNNLRRFSNSELITTGPVSEAMGWDWDGRTAERGFRIIDMDLRSGSISHEYVKL